MRGAAAIAIATALAGCGTGTSDVPRVAQNDAVRAAQVRAEMQSRCANARTPAPSSASGRRRVELLLARARVRTEVLRSIEGPPSQQAQMRQLTLSYLGLVPRYEALRHPPRRGRRALRRAVRAAERDTQRLALAAGVPRCGPLAD